MLTGNLVRLRHQRQTDMAILADFLNQEHLLEIADEMPRFTYKERLEKEFWGRFEKDHDNSVHLTIETLEGKVLGAIGIGFTFWKNGVSFMYHYIGDTEYFEGGYREEALKLFMKFIFMECNGRKLKATVYEIDVRGFDAYKACGFEVEVVHKEDVFVHGKFIDAYDMAILKDDYLKLYGQDTKPQS